MSIVGLYSWAKPNIFFNCRSFPLCLMSYMCLPKWWYPQMRVMKSKQILARLFLTWYLSMASKCSQYWVPFHQLMQARWLHLPVEDDLWGRAFRWLLLLVDFVLVLPSIAISWGSDHTDQTRWSACIGKSEQSCVRLAHAWLYGELGSSLFWVT